MMLKNKGIFAVGVAFLSTAIVLAFHSLYLQRIEELSLFTPVASYYDYCMEMPGGWLTYAATFLTQFFFHPWVGILIYATLAAFATWATYRAFRLRGTGSFMALVPPMMTLLSLLSWGYIIFSLKTPGFAYTPLLGVTAVSMMFWAYRSISASWLRILAVVAVVVGLYPLLGAYSLFAALLCAVSEIPRFGESKIWSATTIVVAVAAIVLWPRLWFAFSDGRLMHTDIYTAILPRIHADEWTHWIPFLVIAVFMVLMAIFGDKWSVATLTGKGKFSKADIIPLSVPVLALICVVVFTYRDDNFTATLAMQRAIDQQDWQKALEVAESAKTEPTRLNSMLTEVALIHTGEAADKLFAYQMGDAEYNSTRGRRAIHDAAASMLCYHLGQTNLAYRWAMEMKVEHDTKVEYLKQLAKCALVNGEYPLARKYLTTLSQTMFHKPWAEKYMAYADSLELISQDPEMALIRSLMKSDDILGVDSGGFELYLRPMLASTAPRNEAMLNLAMQNSLVTRDLAQFVRLMPKYLSLGKRLPRHYQEAVMMWCYLNDSDAYTQLNIDPAVVKLFGQFVEAYQRCQRMSPEQQQEYMRNSFGNTFWYYFVILEDMKVL